MTANNAQVGSSLNLLTAKRADITVGLFAFSLSLSLRHYSRKEDLKGKAIVLKSFLKGLSRIRMGVANRAVVTDFKVSCLSFSLEGLVVVATLLTGVCDFIHETVQMDHLMAHRRSGVGRRTIEELRADIDFIHSLALRFPNLLSRAMAISLRCRLYRDDRSRQLAAEVGRIQNVKQTFELTYDVRHFHSLRLFGSLFNRFPPALKSVEVNFLVAVLHAKNNDGLLSLDQFSGHIIIAFGSVFPDAPDALQELERIKSLGLKGVKLHPDYQGFDVDDAKMKLLYQKISALGLITVFHAGLDYGFAPPYGATPEKLKTAVSWFDSPVVAAHWGGIDCGAGVLTDLCGMDNLYFDTSFGYAMLPKYYAEKILEKHGVEHMLFGTDTPWHTVEMEWRLLDTLGLSDNERDAIAFKNAQKLLHI